MAVGCGGGLLSWDLQSNIGQRPTDRSKCGYLTVRTLNSVKRRKRSRNGPREEKASLVPAGDAHVFGSPNHGGQALTSSILAAGSFLNNQMKPIICKTRAHYQQEGAPPQARNRWFTAWTAICRVLRGQIYTRDAMWTGAPLQARSAR